MIQIQPLADYVLAENEEAESRTKSGLYLPDSAQEKSKIATVLAIGKDVKEIKQGDKIIYKSYSTTELKLDNQESLLVKEEDILATIKGGK